MNTKANQLKWNVVEDNTKASLWAVCFPDVKVGMENLHAMGRTFEGNYIEFTTSLNLDDE